MRAPLLVLVILGVPLAFAAGTTDTREIVADQVYPTDCPGYSTPASVGCFDGPADATSARIVAAPDLGNAQPRMLVWAYNGTQLTGSFWMCDDGSVPVSGAAPWLVVTLHPDREGCPPRPAVIVHGALHVTWT